MRVRAVLEGVLKLKTGLDLAFGRVYSFTRG